MTERDLLADQWRAVAEALGIRFVRNALLRGEEGFMHEFAVLLPQFGAPKGTFVDIEHKAASIAAALKAGYTCSSMGAEAHHLPVDPSDYVDCLAEWGWSSESESPPGWYGAAVAALPSKESRELGGAESTPTARRPNVA